MGRGSPLAPNSDVRRSKIQKVHASRSLWLCQYQYRTRYVVLCTQTQGARRYWYTRSRYRTGTVPGTYHIGTGFVNQSSKNSLFLPVPILRRHLDLLPSFLGKEFESTIREAYVCRTWTLNGAKSTCYSNYRPIENFQFLNSLTKRT